VVRDGDTIDGPGDVHWRAWNRRTALISPAAPHYPFLSRRRHQTAGRHAARTAIFYAFDLIEDDGEDLGKHSWGGTLRWALMRGALGFAPRWLPGCRPEGRASPRCDPRPMPKQPNGTPGKKPVTQS
jgi:hypothetical protein